MPLGQVSRTASLTFLVAGFVLFSGAGYSQTCPGDCNGDGEVSLLEMVLSMRISLDRGAEVSDCVAADLDASGAIEIDETVSISRSYTLGCGAPAAAARSAQAATSGVPASPALELTSSSGAPGQVVQFSSVLRTGGLDIAAVEQEVFVDPLTPLLGCTVNPDINRSSSAFALRPTGCTPGVDCVNVKALILSFSNLSPIPDGSVLFTCDVQISSSAPDSTYVLDSQLEGGSTPSGGAIALGSGDGAITVLSPPTPTPTAVPVQASLILRKVRLKADTASRPNRDNATISVRGAVNANDPFANLVEDIGASGLEIRVTGAGGVDQTLSWGAGDCATKTTALGPRIRCVVTDSGGKRKVSFRVGRLPNLFSVRVSARRLGFQPPLTNQAVSVVVTTTTFQRGDDIGGCVVGGSGRKSVCKEAGFVPTPTSSPTPTQTPTPTSTPTETSTPPSGTTIIVGDAIGVAGGTTSFTVGLETNASVAGTENELQLGATDPVSFFDCVVDPGLGKNLFLSFSPPSCTPGVNCSGIKGLVLSFANLDPIANGSTMYSCQVVIDAVATPGAYVVACNAPGASDPVGNAIATACSDGVITVVP